jgi:hypothetical protein
MAGSNHAPSNQQQRKESKLKTETIIKYDACDHTPEALEAAYHNYQLRRNDWCKCKHEMPLAYYRHRVIGDRGWMCGDCCGIVQIGARRSRAAAREG